MFKAFIRRIATPLLYPDTFTLKAGTLYPRLHDLEDQGMVEACEKPAETGRVRKYYSLTKEGRLALADKTDEWQRFSSAVDKVQKGGVALAAV